MLEKTKKLLADAVTAIAALREYIQAIPDDVVAALPAMPGVDGDWLEIVQASLKAAAGPHKLGLKSVDDDIRAAFEAKYQRDWNDPAGDDMKTIWADAWAAATRT